MSNNQNGWKAQLYLRGSLIGLVVGLVAAYLYAKAAEEANAGSSVPASLRSSDLMKVSLSVLGLVRQITELGNTKQ